MSLRARSYALFYLGAALLLLAVHAPYLDLPFFWDELGQFAPAALDIHRLGAWVPRTTIPNVHPPGLMAYLAAVWTIAGYSIEATRVAMLLVAAAALLAQWLLAMELSGAPSPGAAWYATGLLALSPLFFAQAMMAQLDMPAMLFTALALLLFLRNQTRAAALMSIPLVLVKETGAMVPALFGAWLFLEGRRREALWYLGPLAALAAWLVCLKHVTGHWFGNQEFTEYNVFYPLHPFRFGVALARRIYFLFFENFHWIGTVALTAAWRWGYFRSRAWRLSIALVALHIVVLSATGGAALERYLLPALPLLYAGVAAAFSRAPTAPRRAAQVALALGLAAGSFWNPPYPAPFENNLAFTDFVRLHQSAARHLESIAGAKTIVTAWPFSAALRRPDYGYVHERLRVRRLTDFTPRSVRATNLERADILVLYSRDPEPGWALLRSGPLNALRRRFYGYEPQVTGAGLERGFGFRRVARWERRGQWIEIYLRPAT